MAQRTWLGLRSTADVITDEDAGVWRKGVFSLDPNGDFPLTALTTLAGSEKVANPIFHWAEEGFPSCAGSVTGVYTNAGLSNSYVSGGVAGDTVYLKMSEADASEFRERHGVQMRDASDPTNEVYGKVTARVINGASSYIAVRILEADDNGTGTTIANCDRVLVSGNINPQFGERPDPLVYKPTMYVNYCGIAWNSFGQSRTAGSTTTLRTEDFTFKDRKDALRQHYREMENQMWDSVPTIGTGANGKPEFTTAGVLHWIRTYASSNITNYQTDTDFTGKTWLDGGVDWLDKWFEVLGRYGSEEKLVVCGGAVMGAIEKLLRNWGQVNLKSGETTWGMKFSTWINSYGMTLHFKTNPLWRVEPTKRNRMVVLEPANIKFKYIKDTGPDQIVKNLKDGVEDGFLTEYGLEIHHPETMGIMDGVGLDA